MNERELNEAVERVPAGGWAVGVSGGADSVGLLLLLRKRGDLSLVVAHLDHQTRAGQSWEDAEFVRELCEGLGIECVIARREEIEKGLMNLPGNLSARYRAVRLEFFRQVVGERGLRGVILAHHGDDQAETVLQRLIRGSGVTGLTGMKFEVKVEGVTILRPLLRARRDDLRKWLVLQGQVWREDPSNESDEYLRGRLRRILGEHAELSSRLSELGDGCSELMTWVRESAPRLRERFELGELACGPAILARESARQWLIERGAPPGELSRGVITRLLIMASDLATPARVQFPGGISVRRAGGVIGLEE